MKLKLEIITLYRYFAYAAHMRTLFRREVDSEWLKLVTADMQGMAQFFYSPPGVYLIYSYSGIYLVIEGWKDLGLRDPKIDALIQSSFVDRLRLFRNATFHYQREPISWKHLQFFGTEDERTEEWLNELYRELERFFADNMLPIPETLRAKFKDKSYAEIGEAIRAYWSSRVDFEDSGN